MAVQLMLIHNSLCQAHLVYLSPVNLLLHCTLRQESVDENGLVLSETVYSKNGLSVVAGIPAGVENDATVGAHNIRNYEVDH